MSVSYKDGQTPKVGDRVRGTLYVASTEGTVIAFHGPYVWIYVDGFESPVTRFIADLEPVE